MSVATADLCKAIVTAWNSSGLNAIFKALWTTDYASEFPVLHDQEAPGAQPFPYCVLGEMGSFTTDRMSGDVGLREIRDVVVMFNIHARDISSDSRSPKEIAAYLAEEVMKVFGGHPVTPATISIGLDNGKHVITQYQNDFNVKTGDDECQWIVNYIFRLDVPVAV